MPAPRDVWIRILIEEPFVVTLLLRHPLGKAKAISPAALCLTGFAQQFDQQFIVDAGRPVRRR